MELKTYLEDGALIVELPVRMDSGNAEETRQAIEAAAAGHPGCPPVLDAGNTEYISSAGLRALLSISRQTEGGLTLRSASAAVYDTMQITGFTDILKVSRKMREISVEGCPVIGRGAVGTIYRINADTIVKVYETSEALPMIENEQRRAKQALVLGLPTAISYDVVKVGDRYGSVFELIDAHSLNDMLVEDLSRLDELTDRYIEVIRQVHAVEARPGELPDNREVHRQYLEVIRPVLPDGTADRLDALLREMPENLHVIHGDFHMRNVMYSGGEAMLIDMDTLSVGDPVFDLAGIFVTYQAFSEDDPGNCMEFLGLPPEVCFAIWRKALAGSVGTEDPGVLAEAEKRVRTVGYIRFLELLIALNLGGSLREVRIRNAAKKLAALAPQVDRLTLL